MGRPASPLRVLSQVFCRSNLMRFSGLENKRQRIRHDCLTSTHLCLLWGKSLERDQEKSSWKLKKVWEELKNLRNRGQKTQNPKSEELTDGQKWVEALGSLRTEGLWVWRAPHPAGGDCCSAPHNSCCCRRVDPGNTGLPEFSEKTDF